MNRVRLESPALERSHTTHSDVYSLTRALDPVSPSAPRWATELAGGPATTSWLHFPSPRGSATGSDSPSGCATEIRTGAEIALVTTRLESIGGHDRESLGTLLEAFILESLETLATTAFPHPVRVWNFLPGISDTVADGLDRYQVFNIARHRAFVRFFGHSAVVAGRIPTASCVGHSGNALVTCTLGAASPGVPIENPLQVPAFAYSTKFGPKPPCFARAALTRLGSRRLLLVAGTASIRGEDSTHPRSLPDQLAETVSNLRAVVAQGRAAAGLPSTVADGPLTGVTAARVYYRNPDDLPPIKRGLPPELANVADVEFVRADICREELLVEIEIVVDVDRV